MTQCQWVSSSQFFKDQRVFIFKFKQFIQIPLPNSFDSFLMQHNVHYNTNRNLFALRQPCQIREHVNRQCLLCKVKDHLHKLCCQIKHLMLLYASLTTSEQMGLQKFYSSIYIYIYIFLVENTHICI